MVKHNGAKREGSKPHRAVGLLARTASPGAVGQVCGWWVWVVGAEAVG
jgi:hypothetical protein